jgi:thymidylate synthase (FAD)
LTFIIPKWFTRVPEWEGIHLKELSKLMSDVNGVDYEFRWCIGRLKDEEEYNDLINNAKWQPQQARSVLPNSLKTEINVKMNLRAWRNFFKLRTANAAHPQMRELTRPLLDELKLKIPVIFDDINY